jgi:hypothetical protein
LSRYDFRFEPFFALVKASCFYQQGKRIKIKVALKAVSEQAKPALLHEIGKLLTLLWTLVFEPKHILKMMNHLMDEDGLFGRCAASPALGQIDGSRGIVIHGDGIVLSG